MNNPSLTPLRHGDWHVIDGQLVDLNEVKPPLDNTPAVPESPTPVGHQDDEPFEE